MNHILKNILILLIFQIFFQTHLFAMPQDQRFLTHLSYLKHPQLSQHLYISPQHQHRLEPLAQDLKSMMVQVEEICLNTFQQKILIPKDLKMIFVENTEQMRDLAQKRNQGIPPEWADGLAYPHNGEIYVVIQPQMQTTILHELIHIALFQLDPNRNMPKWLNEGLSIYLSESINIERGLLVNDAGIKQQLISFHHIESFFPKSDSQAQLAYAQSAHFVNYIIDHYGIDAFSSFMDQLVSKDRKREQDLVLDLDLISIRSFGKSISEIEKEWAKNLSTHWLIRWFALLGNGLLWGLLLGLFITLGYQHIKKRRKKVEKLKKNEEKMDKLFQEWETQLKNTEF